MKHIILKCRNPDTSDDDTSIVRYWLRVPQPNGSQAQNINSAHESHRSHLSSKCIVHPSCYTAESCQSTAPERVNGQAEGQEHPVWGISCVTVDLQPGEYKGNTRGRQWLACAASWWIMGEEAEILFTWSAILPTPLAHQPSWHCVVCDFCFTCRCVLFTIDH